MPAFALRRGAKAAAVALTVGGFVVAFAPAGYADAAPLKVTCTGTTTFVAGLNSTQSAEGGEAVNEYKCTGAGGTAAFIGNSAARLAPLAEACESPRVADDEVIDWGPQMGTSELRSNSTEVSQETDNHGDAVPTLVEEGDVVNGMFAGAHYSRVILDPADCDAVKAGGSVTSQVMLDISQG